MAEDQPSRRRALRRRPDRGRMDLGPGAWFAVAMKAREAAAQVASPKAPHSRAGVWVRPAGLPLPENPEAEWPLVLSTLVQPMAAPRVCRCPAAWSTRAAQ